MNPAERLSALLDESPGAARARAAQAFDRLAAGRDVVLVGAGNLGRRGVAAMRAAGAAPVAFADSDPARQGTALDGVSVLSVEQAVRRHAGAAFVITIWGARSAHRIANSEARLRSLGAGAVVPMAHFFWKYTAALPHYFLDLPQGVLADAGGVMGAFALLSDEASRAEYVAQVEARLTGQVDRLAEPVPGEQYLARDLWQPRDNERVVDGGAFDGDTLTAWLRERGGAFAHWLAIEPHPVNAAALRRAVSALAAGVRENIQIEEAALGEASGTIRMPAAGSAGAATAGEGGGPMVAVRPLDDIAGTDDVSFIKLDIEGDELAALRGARRTVARCAPVLAVCAYHRQDHLWRVPLALADLLPGATVHLRAHGAEGWDLVAYAVPRNRRP